MASSVGAVAAADGDYFAVSAPKCAWVIPVLMDSHATAAATLAFRFCFNPHPAPIAPSFPYQPSKV